jgi:hypothetical protein
MTLCQRGPDPAARASMLVLARTAVHATSHGGGIFLSILHLLLYLQALLTCTPSRHRWTQTVSALAAGKAAG